MSEAIQNQPEKAVIFEDVSLRFDEQIVLDGLSFELEHGATKVLLGVAGSGKTTILKLTLGLVRPDSGRIFVLGKKVTAMHERELFELRRRIPGISEKMLTQRLRELEADGLVTRLDHGTVPPHVDYDLSDEGRSLAPVLQAMYDWGVARAARTGAEVVIAAGSEPPPGG